MRLIPLVVVITAIVAGGALLVYRVPQAYSIPAEYLVTHGYY